MIFQENFNYRKDFGNEIEILQNLFLRDYEINNLLTFFKTLDIQNLKTKENLIQKINKSLSVYDNNIDDLQKLDSLKESVTDALSDVINLTSKLTNTKKNLPDKLPDNPMDLSFWIGAHLGGPVAEEQQRLLEERNTFTRLQREYEMLDHTRKQLAARTALKESFPDIKEN